MKSWLKKVIKKQSLNQEKQNINQKKIIVSFDKHQEVIVQKNEYDPNDKYSQQVNFEKFLQEQCEGDESNQFQQEQAVSSICSEDQNYYEENLNMEQQLINQLINMYNLMKMTRHIPELRGQYLTLKQINIYLCSSQVNSSQISLYLMSKSSQKLNTQSKQFYDKKLLNKNHKTKQKCQSIIESYVKKFSNQLIFQYYPVRALLWKVVCGYLSKYRQKWISKMQNSLLIYRTYVQQYILQTLLKKQKGSQKNIIDIKQNEQKQVKLIANIQKKKSDNNDHPLNLKQNSKWKSYFEDLELWNIIQRDTIRTRQSCLFFKQKHNFQINDSQDQLIVVKSYNQQKVYFHSHDLHLSKTKRVQTFYYDCMTRILFIYLKNHQRQNYYQGMNQIVAIIVYSFTNKNSQYFRRVSQSDSYVVFCKVMQKINISPLPVINSQSSFNHFMSGEKYAFLLEQMIKKYDFRLYQFLKKQNLLNHIKSISIRWFMSLFLSEFQIDDCLVLWDVIMSIVGNYQSKQQNDKVKFTYKNLKLTQYLLYLGLTVIHLNRQKIIEGQNVLILLQKITYKPQTLIQKSLNLYKTFPNLLQ